MGYVAGVDVSKDRLHLAVRTPEGEWAVEHQSVANAESGFRTLIQHLPQTDGTV